MASSCREIAGDQHRRSDAARELAGTGVTSARSATTRGYVDRLAQAGGAKLRRRRPSVREGRASARLSTSRRASRGGLAHPLWREEMFLPIVMLHRVPDRDEACAWRTTRTWA